jgi:hypothetical protein
MVDLRDADFSLETSSTPFFDQQSPGFFLDRSSELDVERARKISCCFPKGTVPLFLLET